MRAPQCRRPAVLSILLLGLGGCSTGDPGAQTAASGFAAVPETSASPAPTSTGPSVTAAPSAAPTTTAPPAPSVEPPQADPDLGEEPPVRYDAVSGSGCSPGGDLLPAGWWYGTTDGAPGSTLQFDLACYYEGAAAEAAAANAGEPFWDDYFVVNDSSKIRVIPIADDATASCLFTEPRIASAECAPQQIPGSFAVWIRVDPRGDITRIVEQYAP